MKAEYLLMLATARGINLELGRPRRDIPQEHQGAPRRRVVEGVSIPGVISARGTQDRPTRQPEWTGRELARAAAGMPDRQWRALCWVIGGEEPARAYLKGELLNLALEIKEREGWPDTFRRGNCVDCGCNRTSKYVEDLCTLALTELANPNDYVEESHRAKFFSVAEHNWRRHVSRIYQSIYKPAQGWFIDGIAYLDWRLKQREQVQETA